MFPKLAREEAFWVGSRMFFLRVPIHPSPKRKRERPIWSLITQRRSATSSSRLQEQKQDKNAAAVSFPPLASRLPCRLDREGQPSVPGGTDSAQTGDHLFQRIHLFYRIFKFQKANGRWAAVSSTQWNRETVTHLKGYGSAQHCRRAQVRGDSRT